MKPSSILLVDDHEIVLHGLKVIIDREPDLTVTMTATSAEVALEKLTRKLPDIVVTDISLPGLSGLELIKEISRLYPELPTLVLSMHDELAHGERALRAGAKGYLTKQEAPESVIGAIRAVLAGEVYLSERMQALIGRTTRNKPKQQAISVLGMLSDREREVFRLIGIGLATKEIAISLDVSVKTVDSHRANLKKKLGMRTAPEVTRFAVSWAIRGKI